MFPKPPSHVEALGPGNAGPSLALPYANSFDQTQHASIQQPTCGAAPFAVDPAAVAGGDRQHTQTPYVTGTSVLGVTYEDGVLLASDTLGAYGSTKRYKSFQRLHKINSSTIIGAGGELSDFQYLLTLLEDLTTDDFRNDDGIELQPKEIFSWLTRVLYNRRTKMDPLWNSLVVGGLQDGKPFLGTVGMIGTHYTDGHIATGYGSMLARPLFREKHRADMTEEEATALLHEGLLVCYYRDKTSINKFQIAKVTMEGTSVSEPFALETKWDYKHYINPAAHATGTW